MNIKLSQEGIIGCLKRRPSTHSGWLQRKTSLSTGSDRHV